PSGIASTVLSTLRRTQPSSGVSAIVPVLLLLISAPSYDETVRRKPSVGAVTMTSTENRTTVPTGGLGRTSGSAYMLVFAPSLRVSAAGSPSTSSRVVGSVVVQCATPTAPG